MPSGPSINRGDMPASPRSRISCKRRRMRLSGSLFVGGILRPSAGLLHGLHPLPVQGRPKRAVPSAARDYCVCPAQAPGAMLLSITSRHRTTCATARRKPPPPLTFRSHSALVPLPLRFRSTLASLTLRARSAPLRLPAAPAGSRG